MMTKEELRARPVLLELRLGGCEDTLQWVVNDEPNYSKLEKMTAKDAVEYMMREDSIAQATPVTTALVSEMQNFIEQACKSWYEIATETSDVMCCKISGDGRVFKDARTQPMLDHLTAVTTENKVDIWYQGMTLTEPTFVD